MGRGKPLGDFSTYDGASYCPSGHLLDKLSVPWSGSRDDGRLERRHSASCLISSCCSAASWMIQGAPLQSCRAGSSPSPIMRRIVDGLTASISAASLSVTSLRSLRSPSRYGAMPFGFEQSIHESVSNYCTVQSVFPSGSAPQQWRRLASDAPRRESDR